MAPKNPHRTALVLSGGGARGAYEAGILHYIRTGLSAKQGANKIFNVHCGSSVGAINTCFLASMADDLLEQGKQIYLLWKNLDQDQIYNRNIGAIGHLLGNTAKGITANLFKISLLDPLKRSQGNHFKGFLDTAPLPHFLQKNIQFKKISSHVKKGVLDAVSLTATNMANGQMELFINKRANVDYTGEYAHIFTELNESHAMASAAIPVIFPPVKVNDVYYIDGGLKLNTPLSPAIQLGADRILVIGLHHRYEPTERHPLRVSPGDHPSLGQMVGQVMNALFLDRIQYDVEQLTRINRLIAWSEKIYGADYLDKINEMLIKEEITGDIANRGLKRLRVLQIAPSIELSEIFAECYQSKEATKSFKAFEKMLLRILDIDPAAGVDILSYLAFMPAYIKRLLELGFEDARAHHEELVEFFKDFPQQ